MAIKSESLQIRISPEVKGILTVKATALGMTMSEYVRLLILEDARKTLSAGASEPAAKAGA